MKNSKIYPWIVVGLLWGVALLNYMDRQMLSTMKDAMQVDIVELQSATNFGYLMAIFLWIYALMSPVSGVIADRMSRKWLIVGSLFVWSSITYLMGIAETFNQVVWLRALMGVSEALYIPAGLSLIADYHTGKSRSLAVGIHMTGLYTGQAIGGFGATVADAFSWHTTFHWFGIIGIAYAVILMLFLHDKKTALPYFFHYYLVLSVTFTNYLLFIVHRTRYSVLNLKMNLLNLKFIIFNLKFKK